MKLIDLGYLSTPFYGARKIAAWLKSQNYSVNRKHVQRLMRIMGLKAIYRCPRTSKPAPGHKIYPYLLGGMQITWPNQVWAADITYIPMARGFLYLVAIIDWYSRYVLSWRLSNTLYAGFCVEALEEALKKGKPEIFNSMRVEVNNGGMVESLILNTTRTVGPADPHPYPVLTIGSISVVPERHFMVAGSQVAVSGKMVIITRVNMYSSMNGVTPLRTVM